MLGINIQEGLTDAWTRIASFVPKFLGFLVILIVGYFVAKLVQRLVDGLLERVGFDRWVERGSLREALARSRFDASDVLGVIAFWAVFLLALQLAFGVFGPNPISDLLFGIISYLPNVFVAVVILVVAAALAKVATDVLLATIGAVSGGQWIARAAGLAILVLGIFMALDQLQIAPAIVNGLFYAMLAIIVGSAIVAIGGGGIRTMQRYWEQAATNLESKGSEIKQVTSARPSTTARVPESDQTEPLPSSGDTRPM
jgi:hypothetical protein